MPNENGANPYHVHDLVTKQQTALDSQGRPITAILITFSVGRHGAFSVVLAPQLATPERIRDIVLAKVNELRQTDAFVNQINQSV
jgi:hypothetical protein